MKQYQKEAFKYIGLAIIFGALVMFLFGEQLTNIFSKKEVTAQPVHTCPPTQPIDPKILQLAWKRGCAAGMRIANSTILGTENRSMEELERAYWPIDSVIIQSCIKND